MPADGVLDSGPLLETCAAAGATLVAIIGGLLVARYVTLESELQGAADRVSDTEARLREAEADRLSAVADLHTFEIERELEETEVCQKILLGGR